MKTFISMSVLVMFLIITITLPTSFFFDSPVMLKIALISTGVNTLLFWSYLIAELLERVGDTH